MAGGGDLVLQAPRATAFILMPAVPTVWRDVSVASTRLCWDGWGKRNKYAVSRLYSPACNGCPLPCCLGQRTSHMAVVEACAEASLSIPVMYLGPGRPVTEENLGP